MTEQQQNMDREITHEDIEKAFAKIQKLNLALMKDGTYTLAALSSPVQRRSLEILCKT